MEIAEWSTLVMQHTKIGSIHQNFWCGILVCLVVVCPFLATADQHDTQPNMQEALRTQFTISVVILGFLLLAILIFLVWMLLQCKALVRELGRTNRILGQNFSNIGKRIQDIEKNFDSEVLYQKLADSNETRTQKVLNRLEHLINHRQNDVSSTQEVVLPQQRENTTDEERLSSEIIAFCNRYNAGVQDTQRQTDFLQRYQENHRICVENTMERRLNRQIDPIFKTDSTAGRFLACYIEDEKLYAVAPVYGLILERTILHPGAFVDVFKCPDVDLQCHYKVAKVIQPAVFEPDDEKETWMLKEVGIVELQETKRES